MYSEKVYGIFFENYHIFSMNILTKEFGYKIFYYFQSLSPGLIIINFFVLNILKKVFVVHVNLKKRKLDYMIFIYLLI